ncbi:MAG TPA: carboxypeptidase regulatory-like domain-containing protein [Polyangia bacterium]|nr:carboxypeptidase regulatory-like domain-containing protein [Polyangia bacterium]
MMLLACQRQPPPAPRPALRPPGQTGSATLTGSVRFAGPPPAPPAPLASLKLSFPDCARFVAGAPADPGLLRAPGGGVKDAFVWIREGLAAGDYPVPEQPVLLDQSSCEFSPRVFGIRVGQPLAIANSDPLLHNVSSAAAFNLALPKGGARARPRFERPGVMTPIVCNLHGWMRAWAGVVAHPYFAVSDAAGRFAIPNLPAGTYTVELWQERLGFFRQRVTLAEHETRTIAFDLEAP